ncbi:MAG: glycoside hydrolase family 88 protein [Burkholderiaceae bacterium]|nr:glycoside hydrolase family 88 protein [Burkholderiaceae bacterium]
MNPSSHHGFSRRRLLACAVSALVLTLSGCAAPGAPAAAQPQQDALALLERVNTYWQRTTPATESAFWNVAAYHTGNIEAYRVTGNPAYRRYSEQWAEHNRWMGARSPDPSQWKLSYGETDDFVLFGDWQICFQTYVDLFQLDQNRQPQRIARAREVMEYQMRTARNDYWWWADGLYMVMPVMTKLYRVTGDPRYLDKLADYFAHANSIMHDDAEQLYYRDARFVYPAHQSANGRKDFWARGNGWVFAGLAKVLQDLPADDPRRPVFEAKFKGMAAALKAAQQPDGYWTRSLLDPAHAPGPESSGTAFFTYGYLWGINHGILPRAQYLPVALNGWRFLSKVAVQADGKVGYVQPIGDRALPGQVVDQHSTAHFGVGAVLLAAAEMTRLRSTD